MDDTTANEVLTQLKNISEKVSQIQADISKVEMRLTELAVFVSGQDKQIKNNKKKLADLPVSYKS